MVNPKQEVFPGLRSPVCGIWKKSNLLVDFFKILFLLMENKP